MLNINSNPLAFGVGRNLNNINTQLQETSMRIATGKRIISAKDDPAGIGILSSMKAQHASWNAVQKNLGSGMSLLETASSALKSQESILTQMKDLATQAASDLLNADQRTALQNTFAELQEQLDTVVNRASIFGQNLVGATAANVNIQSGINAGDTKTISSIRSDGVTLGVNAATIDVTDSTKASASMTAIDTAMATLARNQSVIGAQQRGFDELVKVGNTALGSLEAAMTRIESADIAQESTKLQLLQVQQQMATQALALINSLPQSALSLLR